MIQAWASTRSFKDKPDPPAPGAGSGSPKARSKSRSRTSASLAVFQPGHPRRGRWLCPEELRLIVTDSRGQSRTLHYPLRNDQGSIVPAITGHIDDFVLPLMAGAKYAMTSPLDHFLDREIESGRRHRRQVAGGL